jgi:periplasmic protein TonB
MGPTKLAFKTEVAPSILRLPEPIGLPRGTDRFKLILGVSVIIHLISYLVRPDLFWPAPKMNLEENWDVDVDFMGDVSLKSPHETALPDAKKAEQEAVPLNVLPQLPKKFQIEEQKEVHDTPSDLPKEKTDEEAVAEQQKTKAQEQEKVKKMEEDANKVAMDDLRKRLALEKLRQEQKTDERLKAQKDALAKLKLDRAVDDANANSGSAGSVLGLIKNTAYGNALKAAVARNFNLPENFRYSQNRMSVPTVVVINETGQLVSLKLNGSSGSEVYDNAVVAAIKNSVPLPAPPKDYVGREIQFNFGM